MDSLAQPLAWFWAGQLQRLVQLGGTLPRVSRQIPAPRVLCTEPTGRAALLKGQAPSTNWSGAKVDHIPGLKPHADSRTNVFPIMPYAKAVVAGDMKKGKGFGTIKRKVRLLPEIARWKRGAYDYADIETVTRLC